MNATREHMDVRDGQLVAADALADQPLDPGVSRRKYEDERKVVIASTFTADPLCPPLTFWLETLDIPAQVCLAPYAQVLQELLNPTSLMGENKSGFNIVAIRIEDWIRDRSTASGPQNIEHLRAVAQELSSAIEVSRRKTSVPLLVLFCPSSTDVPENCRAAMAEIQARLVEQLSVVEAVHCLVHEDIVRLYGHRSYEDRHSDRVGHIPYTSEYFVAAATLLARRIAALTKPRYKVIAIDCDNTLWKGVCGEDGAKGIELTPAHLAFQRMLVRQHDMGMLLCLCSKNNASDVEAVFKAHEGLMPLREEHLICSRVNWSAKSSNLRSLAEELSLSLDSFIFIDDSPMECAEVRRGCPSVLTLQFPEKAQDVSHFLDHIWAFDSVAVSQEAKQRTEQYKQNRARNVALKEATDLDQFLKSLQLQVDVSTLEAADLLRVAELVQRTNQFNLTTIRRTAPEIEALSRSAAIQGLVVRVRDRFGDYGLVGALFLRRQGNALEVDTFVLSCRVLGRRVEHEIVRELGRLARRQGLSNIILKYRKTARNAPAWAFLESGFSQFRDSTTATTHRAEESVFVVPVEYAEAAVAHEKHVEGALEEGRVDSAAVPEDSRGSVKWHEEAQRLCHISDIAAEISRVARGRRGAPAEHVPPRTATEAAVAEIWADVLGIDAISVTADFLELGGDSVLAVQVIARLSSSLGAELSMFDFFEGSTIEKIAQRLTDSSQASASIDVMAATGPVPLSSAQLRLWFIDKLEGGSRAYHIPLVIRVRGTLEVSALQSALAALVDRHETLRTVFVLAEGQPVQQVLPAGQWPLQLVELSQLGPEQREAQIARHRRDEALASFDLSNGPLIRGRLLTLGADEHVLLITMHHIISDGWSIGVLLRELAAVYDRFLTAKDGALPPLPIQYAHYARWQKEWIRGQELQDQLGYWREHLEGAPELLTLPTDSPRPATQSYRGDNVSVSLDRALTAELKAFARQHNVTLAMVLYAAWAVALNRVSGQDDIVIGLPVANRRRTELEGLIGLFVNTLAVRVRMEDDPSVAELLQRVKQIMLGAYANQDAPFDQVVEAVKPARSLSQSPIFQVMLVLQSAPRRTVQLPTVAFVEEELRLETAQFDLSLYLQEFDDEVSGSLNFATDLFDRYTIERWASYFRAAAAAMVRQTSARVSAVSVLSDDERTSIVEAFNRTDATHPCDKTIHELFEEQAQRTPGAIAVACGQQELTYEDLNARANQLAHYLCRKGISPGCYVGLCTERSVEMLIGLLGILKAGAAYVPLDPSYPTERLGYMVNDTKPKAVLTHKAIEARVPFGVPSVVLDDLEAELAQCPRTNLTQVRTPLSSRALAYVIYTSGSTGQPKGVAIEHRNAVNLIWWARTSLPAEVFRRTLQSTSLNFDLSVYECFVPLSIGGTVHIVQSALDLVAESAALTLINTVPSVMKGVLDLGALPPSTKAVNLAGEPLKRELVERIFEKSAVDCVCNLYAPSETTTYSTWITMPRHSGFKASIGRPLANTRIYILGRARQLLPIGVTGEIYIGGAGVARGYVNRPELTAERFLADPFSREPGARMYKTGDIGRWRPDGTIEYLGRNDHQVKIRGFRIEPNEIELQLCRHAHVQEAVVLAREDVPGDKRLIAYVVPADPASPATAHELRAHLKHALPDYMVPSAFVTLERMPLTSSGKIDRRALPLPRLEEWHIGTREPPTGEMEKLLAKIWCGVLAVETVSRDDDFFEIGGHSLLAMQVVARLQSTLSLDVPIRCMFELPTLRELATHISELRRDRLRNSIAQGGEDIAALFDRLAAMDETEAHDLLSELAMEGRQ